MIKTLSLTKPYLHTTRLKKEHSDVFGRSEISEKATYLKVPTNMSLDSLKNDVKIGAPQFEELVGLVEKEKEPKYILLTVDNLEQGYMAVTYLAAAFNHKDKENYCVDDVWDESLNEDDPRVEYGWSEMSLMIPVIKEGELGYRFFNDMGYSSMGFGGFVMQGNQMPQKNDPYWLDCTNESICIVSERNCGFGFDVNDLVNGLYHFRKNKKVYIISVDSKREQYDSDDIFEDDVNWESVHRSKWNTIVLSLAADEASVQLDKKDEGKYFKLLFNSLFYKRNIRLDKGFSHARLVNMVTVMKDPNKCELMEKIINYALKDKKIQKEYKLSNQDFSFISRFVQEQEKVADIHAKDRMLNSLIGLEDVKCQVMDTINVMKYNMMRKEFGIGESEYHNVHLMLGAPGTAKTTIAKLMGQIMVEDKLLPDSRFICVNGAELKGKYVGHSAPKTKALFEEHDIIVIDEAYSLVSDRGEDDSYSKEAIAQLIIEIEEHSTDKLIIFAGYGGRNVSERNNKMKAFLDANPGIKSRITSTIYFDSYSPQEMVDIFMQIARNKHYHVEDEAKDIIFAHFQNRVHFENFGNGREARSLLETSIVYAAKRLFTEKKGKLTKRDMQTIKLRDVEYAIMQIQKNEAVQESCVSSGKLGFA